MTTLTVNSTVLLPLRAHRYAFHRANLIWYSANTFAHKFHFHLRLRGFLSSVGFFFLFLRSFSMTWKIWRRSFEFEFFPFKHSNVWCSHTSMRRGRCIDDSWRSGDAGGWEMGAYGEAYFWQTKQRHIDAKPIKFNAIERGLPFLNCCNPVWVSRIDFIKTTFIQGTQHLTARRNHCRQFEQLCFKRTNLPQSDYHFHHPSTIPR